MLELISDKTQSLKEFTENNYAQASFFWHALLKGKNIKVNGKRVNADMRLYKGDTVAYYLTPKQEEKPAFYVAYEDENVCIIDKESGVNAEAVFAALQRGRECYFIHRLDRNTQGIMAFALTKEGEYALLKAFKQRDVEKRYHALCFAAPPKSSDVLTAYLKKDGDNALVRIYDTPVKGSEEIITEYAVLAHLEGGMTKLKITLHTGKTHQIRAHLAHVGCPIVGDMKYGNSALNRGVQCARQRLVAKELCIYSEELPSLSGKVFTSRFDAEFSSKY